jgi:hypothetical protein
MINGRFTVNSRALTGYYAISQAERNALHRAVDLLADVPEDRWPAAGAARLDSPVPLYLVWVDDSLRAIVRPTADGKPEVLDLVRHETLQRSFRASG